MANKLIINGQIQDKDRYISISEAKKQMVAMLEEFDLRLSEYEDADLIRVEYIRQDIQEKIDTLKGE